MDIAERFLLLSDSDNANYLKGYKKADFLDSYEEYCEINGHAPFFNDVIDIVYNALKEEILNDITLMDDEEIVGLSERYGFFDLDSIVRAMISSRYFEDINFFMEIMEDVTVHLHLTIMLDEDEINRSLGISSELNVCWDTIQKRFCVGPQTRLLKNRGEKNARTTNHSIFTG